MTWRLYEHEGLVADIPARIHPVHFVLFSFLTHWEKKRAGIWRQLVDCYETYEISITSVQQDRVCEV